MVRFFASMLVAASLSLICETGVAQHADRAGRFAMQVVEGGFIRLDTQTGTMSFCRKEGSEWRCELAQDDARKAIEEIAALKQRNAALESELAAALAGKGTSGSAKNLPDLGPQADGNGAGPDKPGLKLPSEQDVDQAVGYFERLVRKFQDVLKRLEKEQPDAPTPAPPDTSRKEL